MKPTACGAGGLVTSLTISFLCLAMMHLAGEAAASSAPEAPVLVSPAANASLSSDSPQLFTVRSRDPDGDPYSTWVTVRNAGDGLVKRTFAIRPAPSGETSTGMPFPPLPPGGYTWTAIASDLPQGQQSPESASQPFSVVGSPNLGGGALTGSVSYSPAVPAPGQGCASTSFSVTATSAAAVITFTPKGFVGFISLTGSGTSAFCETAGSGSGPITLSATGFGAAATTLECAQLSGQYSRLGTHLTAAVGGLCTINGSQTDNVNINLEAELVPGVSGVGGPMAHADLDGGFVVSPAA